MEVAVTNITPRSFYIDAVYPNIREAILDHGSLRAFINAVLSIDAFMGIAFWYLHDHQDSLVSTMNEKDECFRDHYADKYSLYRNLRDTAFAINHGRLTRGKTPRKVKDTKQILRAKKMFLNDLFVGQTLGRSTSLMIDGKQIAIKGMLEEAQNMLAAILNPLPERKGDDQSSD
ncbi:hypothetical protein [Chelatococcus asaccharovorans]|uniref:hypothetical protein n=1 Tax=Chelatococcus asaccharovorans TaxID=28210 RepID=UPI0022652696|nr:hypothetical protein [Chelatococcus asaccharovorans]